MVSFAFSRCGITGRAEMPEDAVPNTPSHSQGDTHSRIEALSQYHGINKRLHLPRRTTPEPRLLAWRQAKAQHNTQLIEQFLNLCR